MHGKAEGNANVAQTALKATEVSARRSSAIPVGTFLPLGRCVPAGRLHWYVLRVPEGREQAACDRVSRILPEGLADEVFVPCRERYIKRAGAWSVQSAPMWRGYAVAATRNAEALAKALVNLGAQAAPVGATVEGWAPLTDEAQAWLESVMDAGRVVRASVGSIDRSGLRVAFGPLAGQEERVVKIDRHRRQCWVQVCGARIPMPLEVPFKDVARESVERRGAEAR